MRRIATRLAVFVLAAGATATPCHAASLSLVPTEATGFWAGTRLTMTAERAAIGRLRVHVEGVIAVKSAGGVSIGANGCSALLDNVSSYNWSPEHHPAGRQAVPGWPVEADVGNRRHELQLRRKTRVSFSDTVSYGLPDGMPLWTDCVTLSLWRVAKSGSTSMDAFDHRPAGSGRTQARIDNTMFVTLTLGDRRHVECGRPPAFCSLQRPKEFIPPALPDFPPPPGFPGAPGTPTAPEHFAYQVDCTTPTAELGTCHLRPGSV